MTTLAAADTFFNCRWFGRVASPRRTHAITGYYVVTLGTHSRRRSTRNRLFLVIGRGPTLPTSTVRLEMFSYIQSTIDSLVYRWWQRDFWTEHFFGLGPTDYKTPGVGLLANTIDGPERPTPVASWTDKDVCQRPCTITFGPHRHCPVWKKFGRQPVR